MTDRKEDATYDAYLLRYPDGSWLGQLADLPGAYATGATQDEAMARLTAAIPGYFAWLSQHDEYTPTTHSVAHVVVRESVEAPPDPTPGLGAFFADDAQPVSDEDLDWWLAALGWAYEDLQAQAQRTPAATRRDALLAAVAQAQATFVALATAGAQVEQIPQAPAGDPLGRLAAARDAAVNALRATNAEQRATVREVSGQRWSVRRGLRESVLLVRRATDDLAAQA